MNMLDVDKVDLHALKSLYADNAAAQAFLDNAASRKNNMNETTVDRTLTILIQDGHQVSRGEIIDIFRTLEKVGCGRFVTGRRGWQSRFQWDVGLVSVGRYVSGEAEEIEAISDEDSDDEDSFLIQHSFRLRPEIQTDFELPTDLTAVEASRLANFIKTLPFDAEPLA